MSLRKSCIPRFFAPDTVLAATISLNEGDFRHFSQVFRGAVGDKVELVDGRGGRFLAEAVFMDGRNVQFRVLEELPGNVGDREADLPRVTLVTAIPKGKRMLGLLSQVTQLGVCVFQPVICERSVVIPRDKAGVPEKWRQTVRETLKQGGRTREPELRAPVALTEWFGTLPAPSSGERRWILHPYPADESGAPKGSPVSEVLALVGPEGGFTEKELAQARSSGFSPLCLGAGILRVETAGVAAVTLARYGFPP